MRQHSEAHTHASPAMAMRLQTHSADRGIAPGPGCPEALGPGGVHGRGLSPLWANGMASALGIRLGCSAGVERQVANCLQLKTLTCPSFSARPFTAFSFSYLPAGKQLFWILSKTFNASVYFHQNCKQSSDRFLHSCLGYQLYYSTLK